MPQSLSVVYLHLIFTTKDRRPLLRDVTRRSEMHAWLGGVSGRLGCRSLIVGGVEDHVHIVARQGRIISQADWVKKKDRSARDFAWQAGYGVFSVSASNLESVREYVDQQEEHHRHVSFQDEFRALLRKHGESWDERYVWD